MYQGIYQGAFLVVQISDSTMTLHVLQQMLMKEKGEGYAIFLDWENFLT
jgi:hypothetical protein